MNKSGGGTPLPHNTSDTFGTYLMIIYFILLFKKVQCFISYLFYLML